MNRELIDKICNAALDKKAENVVVIDIKDMTVVADNFIICSGTSKTQVKAICDNIEEELSKQGIKPYRIDGYNEARWIVLDFGDILVHVFYDEDRLFYNLERLWNNGANMFVYSEYNNIKYKKIQKTRSIILALTVFLCYNTKECMLDYFFEV